MVGNNVNCQRCTFQVMSPDAKSFKYRKELFVVDIVVELSGREGMRVEHYGVDVAVRHDNGKNGGQGCRLYVDGVRRGGARKYRQRRAGANGPPISSWERRLLSF